VKCGVVKEVGLFCLKESSNREISAFWRGKDAILARQHVTNILPPFKDRNDEIELVSDNLNLDKGANM
jgi:hypothetical protein